MNDEVVLAIVAILATAIGALIWVIKFMFQKIVPLLEGLTVATEKNTKATTKADEYLRQRNGRDNEFHKEVMDGLRKLMPASAKE